MFTKTNKTTLTAWVSANLIYAKINIGESMSKVVTNEEIVPKASVADERNAISIALERFLSAIEDYREAVLIALPNAAKTRIKEIEKASSKIARFAENADEGINFEVKEAHKAKELFEALLEFDRLQESRLLQLMAKSFFIGIFSEYDRFIGELLQAIYTKKPELYKGIKKEISLSELLDVTDINEIKKDILEEEIDSFRRGSYIEQFADLEKKFDIKNLRNFHDWPKFIECAQRRNVMTHNGGCVSQQYITVCEREGFRFTIAPVIGSELNLDPDYLFESIRTISKVGYMLTHSLWKKILPKEVDTSNDAMNDAIYYLLTRNRWKAASEFGEFALTHMMLKDAKEMTKMIRVVNTAIALKKDKRETEAIELLDSIDLSASIREFRLADAVIRGEYKKAGGLMRDIGQKGELINELSYYQWPLFIDFRGDVEFLKAFKEIYNNDFQQRLSLVGKKPIMEVKGTRLKLSSKEITAKKNSRKMNTKKPIKK